MSSIFYDENVGFFGINLKQFGGRLFCITVCVACSILLEL